MLECAIHPITYRGEGILATVVKSMMKKGVVIVEGNGKGTKYILK